MRLSFREVLCAFSAFALIALISACAQSSYDAASVIETPAPRKVAPVPPPGLQNAELSICSNLSLKGVSWPEALNLDGKRSLALGLNISGSFEGSTGWKNLTNNFDGQGLSLGLLNQCLGQGSLQPMLIKLRDRAAAALAATVSAAHRASMLNMLSKWESSQKLTLSVAGDNDVMSDGRLSNLDDMPNGSDGVGHQESSTGDSIVWAKQTLYTDGGATFHSLWSKELNAMASHPSYVTIQIESALKYHAKAVDYMKSLGLKQLRSYLMMFDIIVQNGGLYSGDVSSYLSTYPTNAVVDEAIRLRKILDLRVAHVASKYKADVISRKLSIINGKGIVHGEARDYPKEYCYDTMINVAL